MTQKRFRPLPPPSKLLEHLAKSMGFGLLAIVIAMLVGMVGYHYFEHMTWIDAFLNASMILSGMGPAAPLTSFGGKLFAGFYALFSGLTFILIIGIIMAPLIHHFFHKFHIEISKEE